MNETLWLRVHSRGILLREEEFFRWFREHHWRTLESRLTVKHVVKIQGRVSRKELSACRRVKFGEERFLVFSRFSKVATLLRRFSGPRISYRSEIHPGREIPENSFQKSRLELNENQELAFEFLQKEVYSPERVSQGQGSCVFVMATGLGKTYLGGACIQHWKRKTLVVVPNTGALAEWREMLQKSFPKLKVGEYHSKVKRDGEVVLITVQSAVREEFSFRERVGELQCSAWNYFQEFGAVIYDEVHDYPTDKRQEVFWRLNLSRVLGLTATPDERLDGMDPILGLHLGRVIKAVEVPGFDPKELPWKGEVKVIEYHGPLEYTRTILGENNWLQSQAMYEQFASDPYRNTLVVREILRLFEEGYNIFVFAEQREHLSKLRDALLGKEELASTLSVPELESPPEDPRVQTLMGGATEEKRREARNQARVILITYGYGSQSLSIPRMNAILFYTPRKSKMRQILGRILRRGGDPSVVRKVIDLVDANTPKKRQLSSRRRVYREKEFEERVVDVNWSEIPLS